MSKSAIATKAGALLVAVGASACCWLPLLFVGLGAGTTGAAAFLAPLRPYLMAATVVLLAAAFYYTYRRRTVCAADGSCETTGPSGRSQVMLWGITAVALVSFAFPYWSASRLDEANAEEADVGAPAFEIPVDGMTCAACAVKIHDAVMSVPGVSAAKVDESPGRAIVWTDREVDPAAVVEAIREVGFEPGVPVVREAKLASTTRTAFVTVKGMVQQLGIT